MRAAMGAMRAARRAKPLIQHGYALRRALYRLTHVWSGLGAKGGTRTRTGVTRQNLNLVRLPIPPLSLVALIVSVRRSAGQPAGKEKPGVYQMPLML